MKKIISVFLVFVCILGLFGCSQNSTNADYPASIMVDNTIYYMEVEPMPAEIEESAIIGYTNSYTSEMPEHNGETNFNRELNVPYAEVEDGIAVLYNNEWYLCLPKE